MTTKYTPWFYVGTKPVRVGWYQALYDGGYIVRRRYWSGTYWEKDPGEGPSYFGTAAGDKWRGLAKPEAV
jgi:hypothetical protein